MQDENVFTADIFLDFNEDFVIGEATDIGTADTNTEIFGDAFCQLAIGVARKQFHEPSAFLSASQYDAAF